MYCGNNALHPDLVARRKVIGDRVTCFRKGVGTGLYMPVEMALSQAYRPIDNRKLYCGRADIMPADYDIMGSNYMCLKKGIGVGRMLKAKRRAREEAIAGRDPARRMIMSFPAPTPKVVPKVVPKGKKKRVVPKVPKGKKKTRRVPKKSVRKN